MNDLAQPTQRKLLEAIGAPRASAVPEARRHTARVVRLRRFLLWSCATVVVVVVAGLALHSLRLLPDLQFAHIALQGTRITIEDPRLVGYRKDGLPFEIRAKIGIQDVTSPDVVELEKLDVRIDNSSGAATKLSAAKGIYNSKLDHADLSGVVRIYDDKHYDMRLETATIDFGPAVMKSDKSVTLTLDSAVVSAQSVELAQSEQRMSFTGAVHSVFKGEEPSAAEDGAAEPQAGK